MKPIEGPTIRQQLEGKKGNDLRNNPLQNFTQPAVQPTAPTPLPDKENIQVMEELPVPKKPKLTEKPEMPKPLQTRMALQSLEDLTEHTIPLKSALPSPTVTINTKQAMDEVMALFGTPLETPGLLGIGLANFLSSFQKAKRRFISGIVFYSFSYGWIDAIYYRKGLCCTA